MSNEQDKVEEGLSVALDEAAASESPAFRLPGETNETIVLD